MVTTVTVVNIQLTVKEALRIGVFKALTWPKWAGLHKTYEDRPTLLDFLLLKPGRPNSQFSKKSVNCLM